MILFVLLDPASILPKRKRNVIHEEKKTRLNAITLFFLDTFILFVG